MTELRPILSRLGLAQYVERFVEEGFEDWETVLDITESDLDALGVKLGHRRVLQREIAQTRGLNVEQLSSPFRSGHHDDRQSNGGDESKTDGQGATGAGGKRKYRRHPKTDDDAPERPPSAYVIFSNKLRGELKLQNLSFTAIAKRVGERWQDISAEEKELYESEASNAKEKYHAEMAEYKTTKSYREYQQYLAEFKAKQASNLDGKRPKLTPEEALESTASSGSVASRLDGQESLSGNVSVSSGALYSATSGLPSPASVTSGPAVRLGGLSSILPLGNTSPLSASPLSASPSTPSARRESSTSQSFHNSFQSRPPAERQSERKAMTSSGSDQNYPRIVPLKSREARTSQGLASGPFIEPTIPRGRRSPLQSPRRSARNLTQLQYTPSDSSKSSIASTLSSSSSAASSLYSLATFDGEKRHALSLPPLAALGPDLSSNGSSYAEPAARPALQPLASRTASSFALDRPSQSPVNSSSSTDIPREGNSLRDLSLEQRKATPTIPRGPPEPRHPPHHPNLPSLPSLLRDDTHDPYLHNADPLSVLAYAGRIVGRERETP